MPKKGPISGRKLYTAKELLKMDKYKITGRLKRELDKIDEENKKMHSHNKKKHIIKLKTVVKKMKDDLQLSVSEGKAYHYLKNSDKNICWLAQRTYGVSVSFRMNGENITVRLKHKDDIDKVIKKIKEDVMD